LVERFLADRAFVGFFGAVYSFMQPQTVSSFEALLALLTLKVSGRFVSVRMLIKATGVFEGFSADFASVIPCSIVAMQMTLKFPFFFESLQTITGIYSLILSRFVLVDCFDFGGDFEDFDWLDFWQFILDHNFSLTDCV
jgi:hypothetical protein